MDGSAGPSSKPSSLLITPAAAASSSSASSCSLTTPILSPYDVNMLLSGSSTAAVAHGTPSEAIEVPMLPADLIAVIENHDISLPTLTPTITPTTPIPGEGNDELAEGGRKRNRCPQQLDIVNTAQSSFLKQEPIDKIVLQPSFVPATIVDKEDNDESFDCVIIDPSTTHRLFSKGVTDSDQTRKKRRLELAPFPFPSPPAVISSPPPPTDLFHTPWHLPPGNIMFSGGTRSLTPLQHHQSNLHNHHQHHPHHHQQQSSILSRTTNGELQQEFSSSHLTSTGTATTMKASSSSLTSRLPPCNNPSSWNDISQQQHQQYSRYLNSYKTHVWNQSRLFTSPPPPAGGHLVGHSLTNDAMWRFQEYSLGNSSVGDASATSVPRQQQNHRQPQMIPMSSRTPLSSAIEGDKENIQPAVMMISSSQDHSNSSVSLPFRNMNKPPMMKGIMSHPPIDYHQLNYQEQQQQQQQEQQHKDRLSFQMSKSSSSVATTTAQIDC
eukprot:GHVH01006214.1.p1 GENE.GHVH01006214.1~~GHVH01006214.1.p1  ORF type:complete len:578 (-),score=104.39 GHVH01006214.1:221-1702(-)